MLLLAGGMSA